MDPDGPLLDQTRIDSALKELKPDEYGVATGLLQCLRVLVRHWCPTCIRSQGAWHSWYVAHGFIFEFVYGMIDGRETLKIWKMGRCCPTLPETTYRGESVFLMQDGSSFYVMPNQPAAELLDDILGHKVDAPFFALHEQLRSHVRLATTNYDLQLERCFIITDALPQNLAELANSLYSPSAFGVVGKDDGLLSRGVRSDMLFSDGRGAIKVADGTLQGYDDLLDEGGRNDRIHGGRSPYTVGGTAVAGNQAMPALAAAVIESKRGSALVQEPFCDSQDRIYLPLPVIPVSAADGGEVYEAQYGDQTVLRANWQRIASGQVEVDAVRIGKRGDLLAMGLHDGTRLGRAWTALLCDRLDDFAAYQHQRGEAALPFAEKDGARIPPWLIAARMGAQPSTAASRPFE